MKRFSAMTVLLLFGCMQAEQPEQRNGQSSSSAPVETRPRAPEPLSVECAIGGGTFARACMVDQAEGEDGVTLTVRSPDGGFRRLLVTPRGEIMAADGAERADATLLSDGRVEVSIGGDLYRIPAPAGFSPG